MDIFSKHDQRGITLVELLIAVVLVSLIFAAIGSLLSQSSVYARKLDITYTASYLAERRIELLKRLDFEQIHQAGESNIRIGDDGSEDENGEYLRTTTVTRPYDTNPFLAKIRVEVYRVKVGQTGQYLDGDGKPMYIGTPVAMETLLSGIKIE